MRKIAFVLLAALIAVGCGSSDDSEKETSSSMSSTTVIEETTTTEDEYVAPVTEEEDGSEEDEWSGAQQDSDRDTLVFLIGGVTGSELGFVNDGFSGCIVDAVVGLEGGDYSAALENVVSDDDAYSEELEVAAIGCISYLSGEELVRLTEASVEDDDDTPAQPSDLVDYSDADCDVWGSDPKVSPNWPYDSEMYDGPSLQADARIGAHEYHDRWVLEFSEDSTPPTGWEVMWTGDVVEVDFGEDDWDPTDEVDGSQYLMIKLRATNGLGFPEDEWYDGPWDLYGSDAGTVNLVHASNLGGFEGYSTWAIGANQESSFNVSALDSPARLVIDICH